MSRFFNDLLEDSNDRMGLDPYEDPNDTDPWEDWKLSLKAEPKKGTKVEASKTWQSDYNKGEREESEATKCAVETERDGTQIKTEWSQRKMKLEFERSLYDEDWKAELDVEAEIKQQKQEREVRGEVKVISPDFSGAKLFYNLAVISGQAAGADSLDVQKNLNISYQNEYHTGFRLKTDTKEVTEAWAQAVWTPKGQEDTAYWLRGDKNQKTVSLGTTMPFNMWGIKGIQSWEAQVGTTEGFEGVKGQPVIVRGGYECDLNDATTHGMHYKLGKDVEIWNKNEHKLDSNWTFGFKQRFNSAKLQGSESPYDIGFSMTYKL